MGFKINKKVKIEKSTEQWPHGGTIGPGFSTGPKPSKRAGTGSPHPLLESTYLTHAQQVGKQVFDKLFNRKR